MRGAIDADARGARHPRDLMGTHPPLDGRASVPTARLHSRPASRQRPYPRTRCQLDGARARVAECAAAPYIRSCADARRQSPRWAAALRRDPHVHKTIDMFDRLTKAVVGSARGRPADRRFARRCLRSSLQSSTQRGRGRHLLDRPRRERPRVGCRRLAEPLHCHQPAAAPSRPGRRAIAGGAAKAPAILAPSGADSSID